MLSSSLYYNRAYLRLGRNQGLVASCTHRIEKKAARDMPKVTLGIHATITIILVDRILEPLSRGEETFFHHLGGSKSNSNRHGHDVISLRV